MRTAGRTDIGRIRLVNEDRALVLPQLGGITLAVVADGMGGHQAGDIASQMATQVIERELKSLDKNAATDELEQAVKTAIENANRSIYEYASTSEQYYGMGTTVVVAVATSDKLVIGHIGDSRAYMTRDGGLEQLTEDHSLVNELVRSGQITAEEASNHPRRNVLTRALGTESGVTADVKTFDWKEGDIVLLCSDGLSGYVEESAVREILYSSHPLEEKADMLVDKALEAGGDDNITVVLIENTPDEKG